jgi:hypothetical protein
MSATVLLEYAGRVPCRVVGRVRHDSVAVATIDGVSRVPHTTVRVHACGEYRLVAVERVILDDGSPLVSRRAGASQHRGQPPRPSKPIAVSGIMYRSTRAAVRAVGAAGVTDRLARWRVAAGWTEDEAILTPSLPGGGKRGARR